MTRESARVIYKFIKRYESWSQRRKIRAELESLSDRELADIGIKRFDIDRVIREEIARREAQ